MQDITALLKQLLEAGVHFGHRTNRWDPKMERFIFGEKNGIYIVDLQKTAEGLKQACGFLKAIASKGESILFVGTKKQAQNAVKDQAKRCGMFYVSGRWLGGTLTNFATIRKSIKRLNELESLKESETFNLLSKKERSQIAKELNRLIRNLEGIRKMNRLPSALFVVDFKKEEIAIKEASKLSIPVVALIDTNSDPDKVDFVIPGNDDAIKSIELILRIIGDSVYEAGQSVVEAGPSQAAEGAEEEKANEVSEEEMETLGEEKKLKEDNGEERMGKQPKKRKGKTNA